MADRYWVGGSGTWNTTNTANWSTSSGGPGGAAVPTSADNVYFDSASATTSQTISFSTSIRCLNLDFTGFVGRTSGSLASLQIYGNLTLSATATNYGTSGSLYFYATSGTYTITTNGRFLFENGSSSIRNVTFGQTSGSTATWDLVGDLTEFNQLTFNSGTFNSNNYTITGQFGTFSNTQGYIYSSTSAAKTINLGSSVVTLGYGISLTGSNLTFNAGTSTIEIAGGGAIGATILNAPGISFYNLNLIGYLNATYYGYAGQNLAVQSDITITNQLTTAGYTSRSTLTTQPGARNFIRSSVYGTPRTFTCASVSLTDADFRDITIAGAAAPASGTRLGDCQGNSGITFDPAKTVYFSSSVTAASSQTLDGSTNTLWALTSLGATSLSAYPLPQDTIVMDATHPGTGSTLNWEGSYSFGTVDYSARTTNTLGWVVTGPYSPSTTPNGWGIYGNWIGSAGMNTASLSLPFVGRSTQQFTTAGVTYGTIYVIGQNTLSLQDAATLSGLSTVGTNILTNGYTTTVTTLTLSGTGTFNLGSGTLVCSGTFTGVSTYTFTGGGTIRMTGTLFNGGSCNTYPTLDIYTASSVTVGGSNTFYDVTNTFASATTLLFGSGATNTFTNFNYTGASGRVCTLGASTVTPTKLIKPTAWYVGANSIDGGNNTNVFFSAGSGIDYLNVSYVIGNPTESGANFFFLF